MSRKSKLPNDHGLDRTMQAYHQKIEERQNATADLDDIETGTVTLPELAAIVQQIIDANRR